MGDPRFQLLNDPEEAFRRSFEGRQVGIWTALPGIIQSVDFTKMTCSVQPSVQGQVTQEDGTVEMVNLPVLINVPICFPTAGGFALTLPLKANDEVLVIFASRCIDAWWQQGGIQPAMEQRLHDLSDGFCIPGPCSVPNVIPGISSANAQLRTKDGMASIELTPAGAVNILAPAGVTITGHLVVSGTTHFDGDIATDGKVTAGGKISTMDAIAAVGEITSGLIPLSTHKHGGVTTGPGNSTGPIP